MCAQHLSITSNPARTFCTLQLLGEVETLRASWAAAKHAIKQQRRTIRTQELQLQLLGAAAAGGGLAAGTMQQQGAQAGLVGTAAGCDFPISSFVLAQAEAQQQQQAQGVVDLMACTDRVMGSLGGGVEV